MPTTCERRSRAVRGDGSVLRVIAMHGMGACYACTIEPLRAGSAKLERCSRRFGLSVRETQVLRLLARGRRSVEIASELGICKTTVVTHIRNIGTKTGSRRRSSIIALALGPE